MTLPEPQSEPESLPQSEPEGLPRYDLIPCPSPKCCLSLNGAPGTPKYEKTCCEVCFGVGKVPAPDCPNPQWEKVLRYMRRPFSKREQKSISWDVEATTMQAPAGYGRSEGSEQPAGSSRAQQSRGRTFGHVSGSETGGAAKSA